MVIFIFYISTNISINLVIPFNLKGNESKPYEQWQINRLTNCLNWNPNHNS
ncbi:hypothetical protein UUR7_0391 [Ureaplasma urealyticum serovar 7 str. ATCC 27819]|nr:hypothetical protein UUR7_0391 [Ureaplasma urealyticum serovar 7 str. ATCC 27819]